MSRLLALIFSLTIVLLPGLAAHGSEDPPREEDDAELVDDEIAASECEELTPPRVKIRVEPEYPVEARKKAKQGHVLLSGVVTRKGRLVRIEIVHSSDEIFEQPAIAAVRRWLFEPARCDGEPMQVAYGAEVRFRLRH